MKNSGLGAILVLCVVSATTGLAQTFGEVSFDGSDGNYPGVMALAQNFDGTLFGTTGQGGAYNQGTVFKIDRKHELTTVYSFCANANCMDGSAPAGGLVLGSDGNLYGTTYSGGTGPCNDASVGCGTVFKLTPQGTLITLHSFQGPDGSHPRATLILAIDGNLYGDTSDGGPFGNHGTIFRVTSTGDVATVYNFCAQGGICTDGSNPYSPLVQGLDGQLYGTTDGGGTAGAGTIFQLTLSGKLATLHSFDGRDGGGQQSGLTAAADATFYGTSTNGGYQGYGTIYHFTPPGAVNVIYTFNGDAIAPSGGLIQATDGNFYGITSGGSLSQPSPLYPLSPVVYGTIFSISPGGTLTTLHMFNYRNGGGFQSLGGLLQDTDGAFYGTTLKGGAYDDGTVFGLSMGLGPFVAFLRGAAKVNQQFGILGQGLTGATGVSLNGTPASFTVTSGTFIVATVPVGATTGNVTVTTPTGTLTSNVPFHVIP